MYTKVGNVLIAVSGTAGEINLATCIETPCVDTAGDESISLMQLLLETKSSLKLKKDMATKSSGFTLIELLVVVAIIEFYQQSVLYPIRVCIFSKN